jgi:hypothetical protein
MDFAKISISRQLTCESKLLIRALLRAGLKNSPISPHGIADCPAFEYRYSHWFFTIDVFAGLRGSHGNQRVPMVLRGNQHRIDIVTSQKVTKVIVCSTPLVAVVLVNKVFGLLPPSFYNITDGDHPNSWIA